MTDEIDFSGAFSSAPETSEEKDARERRENSGTKKRNVDYYRRANLRELANTFTGNPDRLYNAQDLGDVVESVTPGALSGLYSLADAVSQAGQSMLGVKDPAKFYGGETAARMYQESRDAANRYFDVEEIEGTGDFVAGAVPSMLVPGPQIAKAKTLLGKVGTGVAAVTLPFAQSKIGSVRHAVEGAVPLAVSEGAAYAAGLPDDVYDSAFRTDEEIDLSGAFEDIDTSAAFNPDDLSNEAHGPNPASDDYTREAQYAAGTALAVSAAYLATKRMNLFHPKHVPHPDTIEGEMIVKEGLPASTYAKQGFLDQHAPFADAARKVGMSDAEILDIESEMNTMLNPVPQANIGSTAIDFGIFPGVARPLTPLVRIARTVGKFKPEDFDLYNRAVAALDMVSRLRSGQVLTDRAGGQWNAARLNTIIQQAQAVPHIAQQLSATRRWYDDMRDVLKETGIIDIAEHARWGLQHPHFLHTQIKHKSGDGPVAQFLQSIGTQDEGRISDSAVIRSLTERSQDPQYGVLPGEGEKPIVLMKKYGESIVRAVLENTAKRRFINKIMHHTQGSGGGLVKQVQKEGENTITVFEAGQQKHYQIGDTALHNAMLNQPVYVMPIVNGMRSMMHFFATGSGNPGFVTSAAAYDTLLAPIMRMNGNSLGPLDELVRKMSGGKLDFSNTFGIDLSAVANWPVGSMRYLYGAFTKEMGDRLSSSIQANTAFARSLSAIGVNPQGLLQVVDDAYMRSMHFLFNSLGGGTNGALLQTPENFRATTSAIAPEVIKHLQRTESRAANPAEWARRKQAGFTASTGWRAYTALMNALHIGVKFQHFAANAYKIPGETQALQRARLIRAAKSSRELTLDASRTGNNKGYRTYASGALWGNVGVQSLYQASRALRDHPMRFALLTSSVGIATFGQMNQLFGTNPEAADKYFKVMTPAQRVQQGVPVGVDERGDFIFAPVDPLMRPVVSVATELYGAIAGHTAAHPRDDERLGAVSTAINQMFGTGLTEHQDDNILGGFTTALAQAGPGADIPAVNLGMRQAGLTSQNDMASWLMQRGEMFRPEHDSANSPIEERSVNAVMPKLIENILTETMGRVGKQIIDGVNTFGRVVKTDASPLTAVDAAIEQYNQSWKDADRGKPIQSLWTKQTNDKKIDTFNEITRRNRMSLDGIDQIKKWGEKGIRGANTTGGRVKMGLPGTSVDASNDKMISLYTAVVPFERQLQMPKELINDLRKQLEDVETSPLLALRPDEKRRRVNELKGHILEQQHVIYSFIQQFEDNVGRTLGQQFRLSSLDLDDWISNEAIQQPAPLPPQR